jgi:DNA-binding NtrC family response regulator
VERTILLVEDSRSQAAVYTEYLRGVGYQVEHVTTGEQALKRMDESPPDLTILDLFLPGVQGTDVLEHIRERGTESPVIVITGNASVNIAVDAMKKGAYDFVTKPFNAEQIRISVQNALLQHDPSQIIPSQIIETHDDHGERDSFHGFIGSSTQIQSVYRIIQSAAVSKAAIFISGESGTGKELCALAIHAESPRAEQAFIAINSTAIPATLMESEIFGHKKGAFTGAESSRMGAALQADGGTLFFDEICDMDVELQAKLLRFVQTGSFKPVGGNEEVQVDVRFICATNRNPLEEVRKGRFREDLYYRLHVVPIELPPLRQRSVDTMQLASYFLDQISSDEGKRFRGFTQEAQQILSAYDWPGNIRQLENIIRGIVVLHDTELVSGDMIPSHVNAHLPDKREQKEPVPFTGSRQDKPLQSLRDMEQEMIEQAIESCDGNVTKAAVLLGVSPSTLYRKRRSITKN